MGLRCEQTCTSASKGEGHARQPPTNRRSSSFRKRRRIAQVPRDHESASRPARAASRRWWGALGADIQVGRDAREDIRDDVGSEGREEEQMAPIVSSIEIARPPEEVFAYLMDPSRLPEWQESLVSARAEGGGPPAVGSKLITTRRVGRRERTMTMEMTSISPPRSWAARGIDGPIRAI